MEKENSSTAKSTLVEDTLKSVAIEHKTTAPSMDTKENEARLGKDGFKELAGENQNNIQKQDMPITDSVDEHVLITLLSFFFHCIIMYIFIYSQLPMKMLL